MNKRKNNVKKIVAAVVVFFSIIVFFFMAGKLEKKIFANEVVTAGVYKNSENEGEEVLFQGNWYEKNSRIETVMLIGVDTFTTDTKNEISNDSKQADFIAALVINNEEKSYHVLQINRDTMTNIKMKDALGSDMGTSVKQIALAYAYESLAEESCANTKWALENLLYGISIDHYLSFTMDAVSVFNDLVGGVTVTIEDDFSGIDSSLKKGETINLMGEQALTFVRARKNLVESTNIARMDRQKEYLSAFLENLKECTDSDENFIFKTVESVLPYMNTDYSTTQMAKHSKLLENYVFDGITSLEGSTQKGSEYTEFYVDENALKQTVINLFYRLKQ